MHVKPIAEQLLEKVQEMEGRAAVLTGLTTGFADLDKMTSGLQSADLIILAARPSMGKTSFALMLAENAAIHVRRGSRYVFARNVEGVARDAHALFAGQTSMRSVFATDFFRGPSGRRSRSRSACSRTQKSFSTTLPGLSVLEMRAKARRLAAEQKKLDLIIVDYLQLMSGSAKRAESRQQEVSQISRELKGLAKELNVPLVALSQLSRAPESRSDHRPQLADLRESGALEQDADVVAFIFREEQYKTPEEREACRTIERTLRN